MACPIQTGPMPYRSYINAYAGHLSESDAERVTSCRHLTFSALHRYIRKLSSEGLYPLDWWGVKFRASALLSKIRTAVRTLACRPRFLNQVAKASSGHGPTYRCRCGEMVYCRSYDVSIFVGSCRWDETSDGDLQSCKQDTWTVKRGWVLVPADIPRK